MTLISALLLLALATRPATYQIDPAASEAGFDLKATMHTVRGTKGKVSGTVRVGPEPDGGLTIFGKIQLDATSLVTGNSKRDATMHDESLNVQQYPAIVFAAERFTPSGPPAADETVSGTLSGQITIRGKTRPASIAATIGIKGDRVVATGKLDILWAEFGVPDPSFAFIRIDKTVHAHFRAELVHVP